MWNVIWINNIGTYKNTLFEMFRHIANYKCENLSSNLSCNNFNQRSSTICYPQVSILLQFLVYCKERGFNLSIFLIDGAHLGWLWMTGNAPLLVYEAEFQITLPPHLSSLGLKDTDGRLAGIQPKRCVPIWCQALKRETSHLSVNCLRSLWHQMSLNRSWATTYVVAILVLITLIYPNGPPIALNRKLGISC